MLQRLFKLEANQTTVSREVLAGLTTLVTMAYIVIVAPEIMSHAGMNEAGAFVSVCIIAALATTMNGLFANLPFGFAPGLGLLSYFSYVVVQQHGISWQAALGAVVLSGIVFMFITVTHLRKWIIKAIPSSLGCAIAAGVGFFIGFIALKNVGVIVSNPHTLVSLGHVNTWPVLLFFLGFLIIAVLDTKRIPGAILIGMAVVSIIGFILGIVQFHGVLALPPKVSHAFFAFELKPWLSWQAFPIIFTFFIVALFDSTGTVLGLTHHMGRDRQDPKVLKQINRTLMSESVATTLSGLLGTSTVCPFVESAAGIRAGGRTGLTSLVIAVGFLLLLFFSPLALSVPGYATSAALFYVCCMMIKPFASVDWSDSTEFIPAIITLLMIPLTFSIADGVGLGLLCYVILKLASGRWRDIHIVMWGLAIAFVAYFWLT